jgi:hypothetical protein
MSGVRGVHVPGAIGAVDEARKGKPAMQAKEPAKGKGGGKKPAFPGAAKPFTKKDGGKKSGKR